MLRDGDRGWAWITSHLDGWRRREITVAGDRAVTMLGGYMIATGVLGMFNAVTGYIIMVLLGLPLALPVAVLSFFGGFIPYIGQFITSRSASCRVRVRLDPGHHHDGHLDRRAQHRPGKRHRAARLRPCCQPPSRHGADRDPGGRHARRRPRDVPWVPLVGSSAASGATCWPPSAGPPPVQEPVEQATASPIPIQTTDEPPGNAIAQARR